MMTVPTSRRAETPSRRSYPMHRLDDGAPLPLGAGWDGKGVNFALFSAHATRVELCLFEPSGQRETDRISLPCRS